MKAIALKPHTKDVELKEDWPDPTIKADDDVKVEILEVGICGTDREEVSGGRADAPAGENLLVIGHEMLGKVVEIGKKVKNFKKGDLVVITVRRGCGICEPCKNNCYDMCKTGKYQERGIKQRHGYQCEYVVEKEMFLVKVPDSIKNIAVLTEPTTVVEKAIDESIRIQDERLPYEDNPAKWLKDKKVLIAGLGPIGLLAAMVLRLKGVDVTGIDIVDPDSKRPQILKQMGGKYIKSSDLFEEDFSKQDSQFDMILEAAGIAKLDFDLIKALANNGIYVLTGVPGDSRDLNIKGGDIMKQLVLKNQLILGSVNAGNIHFTKAISDLEKASKKWPNLIDKLITKRVPYTDFKNVLFKHDPNEIKAVIKWK
jgi:glucose 1-dehydrogenase